MGQGGSRPRQPADQRYENAYLFGAICPARGKGAALALPFADTPPCNFISMKSRDMSQRARTPSCCLIAPDGIRPESSISPKTYADFSAFRSPELNSLENIWQYLRANWLSNRVFETYDAIIDAACDAWRKLIAQPQTITSIGMRDWAHIGQSQ